MNEGKLPVHGFVLAGGKSSRMGQDKALLEFHGKPLVEIAVEKLRSFCAEVSICGNRDDLSAYTPVVREERVDCGPAAGIEAGLKACTQLWALFVPVDVPLVPVELLRRWAEALAQRAAMGCGVSFLLVNKEREPGFSMVRCDALPKVSRELEAGVRRLDELLMGLDDDAGDSWLWMPSAADFTAGATTSQMQYWFSNLNTPAELMEAEAWMAGEQARANADSLRE